MGNSMKHMVKDFRLCFYFGCILGNVLLNNMEGEDWLAINIAMPN
jgi:hypothetical protein